LQAYGWIKEHGGLVTEQQYEYVSEDGDMPECDLLKLKSSKAQRVTLKSFTQVPVGDEDALRKAIAHHPVSVAVAAQAWQVRVRVYVCVCACVCVCVCVLCVSTAAQNELSCRVARVSMGLLFAHPRTPLTHREVLIRNSVF